MALHTVVLRLPSYSLGRRLRLHLFGGPFVAPPVDLGERCVCCDADHGGLFRPLCVTTDKVQARPIQAPVCVACADHALATGAAELAGLIAAVALVAAGWGALEGLRWLVVVGLVALLGSAAYLGSACLRRRAAVAAGHHVWVHVRVVPGQTVLRTTNPRLAREVAARHADLVHRAT
jgi:hypothetical protein